MKAPETEMKIKRWQMSFKESLILCINIPEILTQPVLHRLCVLFKPSLRRTEVPLVMQTDKASVV